jgi:hypothetical protein
LPLYNFGSHLFLQGRTEDDIVKFMRKQPEAGLGAQEVTTVEELEGAIFSNGLSNKGTVVGFLSDGDSHKQVCSPLMSFATRIYLMI